jgi:hypothetical protein
MSHDGIRSRDRYRASYRAKRKSRLSETLINPAEDVSDTDPDTDTDTDRDPDPDRDADEDNYMFGGIIRD